MRRFLLIVVLLLAAAALVLWQFGIIVVPAFSPGGAERQSAPDLFAAVRAADTAAVRLALEDGADPSAFTEDGSTVLLVALENNATPDTVRLLLSAGASPDARNSAGYTPLLAALRHARPESVLLLLNAGADPTVRTAAGESAADLAALNPHVNGTRAARRAAELADAPFDPDWPAGYAVPVEGATISSRASHLPGALRAYRNGRHEGFDFYSGTVSVPITYGTPVRAVADGRVIRADHDYAEMTLAEYDEVIAEAQAAEATPPELLDRLRGRQVWIEHAGGFVSRYAHLSAIDNLIQEGSSVVREQTVGLTGNSGTLEAAEQTEDDPHPHVEIWQGDSTYLGAGLEPEEIWQLSAQVFGQEALPPFTE